MLAPSVSSMRRPASVNGELRFLLSFFAILVADQREACCPLFTMFFLLRRVLEKPVPYVRFWLNDNVLGFGPQSCSPFSASRPASIRTLSEPCPARCKLGSLVSFQALHRAGHGS